MKRFVLTLVFVLLIGSSVVFSGGISSPNGSMYLGNLKIGQTYLLSQLLGFPFRVTYNGAAMVDVKIDVVIPEKSPYSGFEPLPAKNWLLVSKPVFSLDPGQLGETDIEIKIPDDESFLGKKFHVQINPQTSAPRVAIPGIVYAVGLLCNLRLEIASKPPTMEEIRQIRKARLSRAIEVLVSPERIFLNRIEPGEQVDIWDRFEDIIKIVNSSNDTITTSIRVIDIKEEGLFLPDGYEQPESLKWLKPKKNKIKLKKNSIEEIPLFIKIPKGEQYYNKRYYFVIVMQVFSKSREIKYLTKVYVETAKKDIEGSGETGIEPGGE